MIVGVHGRRQETKTGRRSTQMNTDQNEVGKIESNYLIMIHLRLFLDPRLSASVCGLFSFFLICIYLR